MHTCCKGQATEAALRQADTGETSRGGKRTAGTFRVLIIYMIHDQNLEYLFTVKTTTLKLFTFRKWRGTIFVQIFSLGFFPGSQSSKLSGWPASSCGGRSSTCRAMVEVGVTQGVPRVERHFQPCSGNDLSFMDIQPWLHETSVPPINHLRVPVMIVPSTIAMRLEQENLARCMMLVCQSFWKLEGGGVCGFTVLWTVSVIHDSYALMLLLNFYVLIGHRRNQEREAHEAFVKLGRQNVRPTKP